MHCRIVKSTKAMLVPVISTLLIVQRGDGKKDIAELQAKTYRMCPSTESPQGHIIRISAKRSDVILNPFQQELLILQAHIQKPFLGHNPRWQETKRPDPVVERHCDHGFGGPRRQVRSHPFGVSNPSIESPPVEVDHHGQFVARFPSLPPKQVEVQTILALLRPATYRVAPIAADAGIELQFGVVDPNRRSEAAQPFRRQAVRNAQECVQDIRIPIVQLDAEKSSLAQDDLWSVLHSRCPGGRARRSDQEVAERGTAEAGEDESALEEQAPAHQRGHGLQARLERFIFLMEGSVGGHSSV